MILPESLKAEYDQRSADRDPYLQVARDCSKLTLPALLPPSGKSQGTRLRRGYSNFGARCVNSLAAKLLLAILPARQAFFRLRVDRKLLAQLGGEKVRTAVEKALAEMEDVVQEDIETTPTRTPLGEGVKHLLVAGNVLIYLLPKGGLKVYPLHSYVCLRDGEGNPLRTVAVDRVSPLTLPESVRGKVRAKLLERNNKDRDVEVYTGVFRTPQGWTVWQEVEGIRIPESKGTYTADTCPWLPLRWTPVDGDSYGRGMVEDYLGYLTALEALTAAVVKGTAIAVKVVYLRNPNGLTKARSLAQSETGDVIDGKPDDVHALQSEKQADLSVGRQMIADLKEELSYAFALSQAIQRNAERVTAEEIRFMAQELDALLGGIYSTLSLEFQMPYLRNRLHSLSMQKKLPTLPQKALHPSITTGLDALGRGAELDNLRAYVKDVVDLGGPDALKTFLYFDDLLARLSTARGIKTEGLIKPKDVVEAESQQAQMAQMVQHLGPNAVTQMGQLAKAGMPTPTTPQGA